MSTIAVSPTLTTSLPATAVAKTWKAAQDFEAMTLNEMLKPMFDTVDTSKGPFGGGEGEAAFRPMMLQEMTKSIAAHGGLGIASPVFRSMLAAQEAQSQAARR